MRAFSDTAFGLWFCGKFLSCKLSPELGKAIEVKVTGSGEWGGSSGKFDSSFGLEVDHYLSCMVMYKQNSAQVPLIGTEVRPMRS